LDAPRGQHSDAEGERSGRPIGGDNVCRKVERCPIAASGRSARTDNLQGVSQHSSFGLDVLGNRHAAPP
jgi:hypothetical protein